MADIKCAKDLLVEGRLPLAEAALSCGFASQQQFTTSFRARRHAAGTLAAGDALRRRETRNRAENSKTASPAAEHRRRALRAILREPIAQETAMNEITWVLGEEAAASRPYGTRRLYADQTYHLPSMRRWQGAMV